MKERLAAGLERQQYLAQETLGKGQANGVPAVSKLDKFPKAVVVRQKSSFWWR